MSHTNQVIELLSERPRISSELPYKISSSTMSQTSRERIRHIRVTGRRVRTTLFGHFQTVYYLDGDCDRAVKKFVEVNINILKNLDMSRYTALDSGLTKELAQKVRSAFKKKTHDDHQI